MIRISEDLKQIRTSTAFAIMAVEVVEQIHVEAMEAEVVPPSLPTPKEILYLSNVDDQHSLRLMSNTLLLYTRNDVSISPPAKVIREALSKVLVYYYPLAGRLRNRVQDGKLQVECTGEGAVFVEASSPNTLSLLGDLDEFKSSFQQLLFQFPPNTPLEGIHPLILQVTCFSCGGFVVGVSVHHSLCDGIGATQFLNALAEMARGHVELSVKPVWDRYLLKPRDPLLVEFEHLDIIEHLPTPPLSTSEELAQTCFVLNSKVVQHLKQFLMKESKQVISTFEVVAALAWRARTKALQIPRNDYVKLLFAVDMRTKLKPPLPLGFYGNAISSGCACTTAQHLLTGSILDAINIIRKSNMLLDDKYMRSNIDLLETQRDAVDVYLSSRNMYMSDLRQLGLHRLDFGWGEAAS
ncbi:hypothetical protein KI387_004168, partial [Taxus chinensis]